MKKAYFAPEISISVFAAEEIIMDSSIGNIEEPVALSDTDFDVNYDELFG